MATIAASAPRAGTPITNKTLIGRIFLTIFDLETLIGNLFRFRYRRYLLFVIFFPVFFANYLCYLSN